MDETKRFYAVFQLSKTKVFTVEYTTEPCEIRGHFATRAAEFCRNKRDYSMCGQCQPEVTEDYPEANAFYRKWNRYHLRELTDSEYAMMVTDMGILMSRYNYITDCYRIGFETIAEWSKMKPKKTETPVKG